MEKYNKTEIQNDRNTDRTNITQRKIHTETHIKKQK